MYWLSIAQITGQVDAYERIVEAAEILRDFKA